MTPSPDPAAETAFERRNEYVEQHLHLVDQIARKLYRRTPPNIELDDLVQAGRIGLIGAAARFTRAMNVAFGAYARKRIEGEMRELLRRKNLANGQCLDLRDLNRTLAAPTGEILALERRLTVVSILDRLPAGDRQVLEEHYFANRRGSTPRKVGRAIEMARRLAA